MNEHTIKIKTLTPLWTGDVEGKCKKIKETGIIGSLRWWYETLVRGLGGYACDPTSKNSCSLDYKKYKRQVDSDKSKQDALDEQICPVCQLFGCTGWGKRLRFETQYNKNEFDEKGYRKGQEIIISIKELFSISREQKWLFSKTLWIVENYGVIGGRTTCKPNGRWGTDYGLIKIEDYDKMKEWDSESNKDKVVIWLKKNKEKLAKDNCSQWINFRKYWIVNGVYLNRDKMNSFVNRWHKNPKKYDRNKANDFDKWLGGKQGKSKKIFSFKEPKKKVFGYVRKEEEIDIIKEKIQKVLKKELKGINFKIGKDILEDLV